MHAVEKMHGKHRQNTTASNYYIFAIYQLHYELEISMR